MPLKASAIRLTLMPRTVDDDFCKALAERVLREDNMQRLELLHLSANKIGGEGAAALAALPNLRRCGSCLARNPVGDEAKALAATFPQCPRLHTVWLRDWRIGDAAGWRSRRAPRCEALEQLWHNNELSEETKAALRDKALRPRNSG